MRRAGAGLIVAVLALAGCKSTDSKSGDDKLPGGAVGRTRKDKDAEKDAAVAKGPGAWLNLPGAGTDIPRGTGTIARDANGAARERLSGFVYDPYDRPARDIYVRVEEVGAPAGLETGVYTNDKGYFESPGKPGKTYELTAKAKFEGREVFGVVQTRVPSANLRILLRDDLGTFPPAPKPSDRVGETGLPPKAPADGAWAPGGPVSGTPPASIGGGAPTTTPRPPAGGGQLPAPDDSLFPSGPARPVTRPESVADGQKEPFKAPPVNIPGPGAAPPVPPLPALPPSFGPAPGPAPGGRSATGGAVAPRKLALVDTLDRPWDMSAVPPGSLVLIEFMDTTSEPCREFLPVLKDLQSRYGASGLQLAGVVCDELPHKDRAATAAKYGRDNNLNYALYVEPGKAGSVRDQFRVERYPDAVLLDSAGQVLWRGHPGDSEKLEAAVKRNLGK